MKTVYSDILMELRHCLEKYDCVFLFCNNTKLFEDFFAKSLLLNEIKRNIKIYSCNKVRYPERISHARIGLKEEKIILEIYQTYEFSDKFHVIDFNEMYGSLFQYMETGVLTVEETINALLY